MREPPRKNNILGKEKRMEDILREKAQDFLMRVGVSPGLNGFSLLVEAIVLVAQEPQRLRRVCKLVYPEIAQRMGMKENTVSRSIWITAQRAFDSSDLDEMIKRCGYAPKPNRGYYTPREFIKIAALMVEREMRICHEG